MISSSQKGATLATASVTPKRASSASVSVLRLATEVATCVGVVESGELKSLISIWPTVAEWMTWYSMRTHWLSAMGMVVPPQPVPVVSAPVRLPSVPSRTKPQRLPPPVFCQRISLNDAAGKAVK